MKQVVMILALVIGLNVAHAQQRGVRGAVERNPEARAKAKVERIEKALQLTPQQKDSIHSWVLAQAHQQQQAFQEAGENRQEIRAQMKASNAQTDSKILSILDEGQKQKYAAWQKEQAKRNPAAGSRVRKKSDRNK